VIIKNNQKILYLILRSLSFLLIPTENIPEEM